MSTRESSPLIKAFETALQNRSSRHLRRCLTLPTCHPSHDFSSNDFLSLSHSPAFRSQFLQYVNDQPADHPQGLASGGSRLLDGNSEVAENLEKTIARFHDAESALLFNSGYDANVGVFSCIPQPKDIIVYDELIHASIHDGMRLSRASECISFVHNSVEALRDVLYAIVRRDNRVAQGRRNVFVAVESVYSMDGDVAPVNKFVDVLEEVLPDRNGHLMVDEAHATGVFGPKGAGVVQMLGEQRRVFIRVHTFGKALASHGAAVLCSAQTRDYLINYARSLIYTTALPFASLASIRTAYEMMGSQECDELRLRLDRLIAYCHESLLKLAPSHNFSLLSKNTSSGPTGRVVTIKHEPLSPIFSLHTPSALDLAAMCQKSGFMVRAVRPPTVPRGTERVRLCLHSGNTTSAIDGLVATVATWVHGGDTVAARL